MERITDQEVEGKEGMDVDQEEKETRRTEEETRGTEVETQGKAGETRGTEEQLHGHQHLHRHRPLGTRHSSLLWVSKAGSRVWSFSFCLESGLFCLCNISLSVWILFFCYFYCYTLPFRELEFFCFTNPILGVLKFNEAKKSTILHFSFVIFRFQFYLGMFLVYMS